MSFRDGVSQSERPGSFVPSYNRMVVSDVREYVEAKWGVWLEVLLFAWIGRRRAWMASVLRVPIGFQRGDIRDRGLLGGLLLIVLTPAADRRMRRAR